MAFAENSPSPVVVVGQPRLQSTVTAKDGQVTAKGSLVDEAGHGLSGRSINVFVDDIQIGVGHTDAKGAFSISAYVPVGTADGTHQAQVVFPGDGIVQELIVEQQVQVGNATGTVLTAGLAPTSARAGDLVTLSGRLTDAAKAPVAGAWIAVGDATRSWAGEIETDPAGNFSSRMQVPAGTSVGKHPLNITFGGMEGHHASSVVVVIDVPPGGFTPAPQPSRTPSISPSEPVRTPGQTDPTPSVTPTPSPLPTTASGDDGGTWWNRPSLALAAVAALGVVVSLLSMGHAFREPEAEQVSFIGPPDEPRH